MRDNAHDRASHILIGGRSPQGRRLLDVEAGGDVPVQWIMRRGLIGDDIGDEPTPCEGGKYVGTVPDQAHRQRRADALGCFTPGERFVERRRGTIEVTGLEPALHAGRVHLDGEAYPVVHRGREGLRTAHAAEPARDDETPAQGSTEVAARYGAEGLVSALQDALRTDVDPRASRH